MPLAHAAPQQREMRLLCGNEAELAATLKNYSEVPMIFASSNEGKWMYSVWANYQTQTSTWVIKIDEPDTYCVMGVGTSLTVIAPEAKLGKKTKFTKPLQ